jgi:hypothetical protein
MSVDAPGLQIEQDGDFQRAEWRVQRVGWIVLAVLLALAALGLFGNGPLSHRTVQADGLTVTAQRFARNMTQQTLTIDVGRQHVQGAEAVVLVSRELLAAVEIQQITPTPSEVASGRDHLAFTFPVERGLGVTVVFAVEAEEIGLVEAEVAVPDGTRVDFWQLLYP